jgi:hypothetical protein
MNRSISLIDAQEAKEVQANTQRRVLYGDITKAVETLKEE